MFCPECGKNVEEGAVFCPDCGAKVSEMQKVGVVAAQTKNFGTKKGFFASLFDFSFTELITTKIIKVLYGLGILGAVLLAGSLMIPAIKYSSAGQKILALILFPLVVLLYIIILRVFYEIIIVIFRIAEYTREIARQGQRKS
jgi:hypothetical protein